MHKPSLITNHLLQASAIKLRREFIEVAKSTAQQYIHCDVKHEGKLYKISYDSLPDVIASDQLPEPLMEVFTKILALNKRRKKIELAIRTMSFHIDDLTHDPVLGVYVAIFTNPTTPYASKIMSTLKECCPQEFKYLKAMTVAKTMD